MNKTIQVDKYTYNLDKETFNIYIFPKADLLEFYIERENYGNLYHCVGIHAKDKPDDMNEFIKNNLDSWVFIVMNETEED